MRLRVSEQDALLIVDVQNDFMPDGALPVPDGDGVVSVLNKYIEIFGNNGAMIVASRDWHPVNHTSFKEYGGIWPAHCIQDTYGAQFHKDLLIPENAVIVSKATSAEKDAYSAFDGTKLDSVLKKNGIKRVFVGGLATDYCVKATVLDALKNDFCTFFLKDASRGVNVKPEDEDNAIMLMLERGAMVCTLDDF